MPQKRELYEYLTYSQTGDSDLPERTDDWCGTGNNVCFYPIPCANYLQIWGEVKSNNGSEHRVVVDFYNYETELWEKVGELYIPGTSTYTQYVFDLPANFNTHNHLLIFCQEECDLTVRNGAIYYSEFIPANLTVDKTITCLSAGPNCGDEGPEVTYFQEADTPYAYCKISADLPCFDFYGHTITFVWGLNGEIIDTIEVPFNYHYVNYTCAWSWITQMGTNYGGGDGQVDIYFDSTYLGSKTFTVEGASDCTDYTNETDCEANGCHWWNGTCHFDPPDCTELNNQTDCLAYNCFWYNGACHSSPVQSCEDLNNETDCLAYQCYWYDGSCHGSPPPSCSDYTNMNDCINAGCYWWNDSCHDYQASCEEYDNQYECMAFGCYWYNNSCHSTYTCEDLENQNMCEAYGCYWYNNSCHSTAPTCEDYDNENDCLNNGCYWYNNSCHSSDQPELCDWIDSKGGPDGLTITDVFEIIDSYVFQTPPPGYSFIPTLAEVFGVIDYYLGFDGDAATGCDYY